MNSTQKEFASTAPDTQIKGLAQLQTRTRHLTEDPPTLWFGIYNQYAGYDILQGPVNPTLISSSLPDITLRSFDSLLIK